MLLLVIPAKAGIQFLILLTRISQRELDSGFRRNDELLVCAGMTGFQYPIAINCSAIGPNASAGRKVNAPITMTVQASSTMNSGVCVGSVPADCCTCFFAASEPATASMPIASGKRAKNMQMPSSTFQNGVFADSPANALPLLFAADDSA